MYEPRKWSGKTWYHESTRKHHAQIRRAKQVLMVWITLAAIAFYALIYGQR